MSGMCPNGAKNKMVAFFLKIWHSQAVFFLKVL